MRIESTHKVIGWVIASDMMRLNKDLKGDLDFKCKKITDKLDWILGLIQAQGKTNFNYGISVLRIYPTYGICNDVDISMDFESRGDIDKCKDSAREVGRKIELLLVCDTEFREYFNIQIDPFKNNTRAYKFND
jgi:hypothetical protein